MRTQLLRSTIFHARPTAAPLSISKTRMSSGVPSATAQVQKRQENMTTSGPTSAGDLNIESQPIEATGVKLSEQQKVVVGSVLDLFKGLPTLQKLALWTDDATFADPITKAEGRKQYAAQWYGLKAAFSEIDQLSQKVTSDKNPITMELKTRYKIAGVGSEKVIESLISIWTKPEGGAAGEKLRITKVEDKWSGDPLPEGPFAKVRSGDVEKMAMLANPFWWGRYGMDLSFWALTNYWGSWWWEAFRNLNSVVVPAMVSVPKSEEEEAKEAQK